MRLSVYYATAKRSIDLALLWHSSTIQTASRNHDIVSGILSKYMKSLNLANPWVTKDFFTGVGYYTHNTEGYVPRPESLLVPSRPPPAN